MSTYISSKKVITKIINLTLLLSTTHFALISPVLADFDDGIQQEENFTKVHPENLSHDYQELENAAKERYEKTSQKAGEIVEEVREKVIDLLHFNQIKKERDEAMRQAALEKAERDKIAKNASELANKLTDKKGKVSQLKTELKQRENKVNALKTEKETLSNEFNQTKIELNDLKLAQELLKKKLCTTEEDLNNERLAAKKIKDETLERLGSIEQKHNIIQTERDDFERNIQALKDDVTKLESSIAEKEQLLSKKDMQVAQLTESLTAAQRDYNTTQEDIAKLQEEHAKEKLTLSEEWRSKRTKLKGSIAEKEQLLSEKDMLVAQLEQEQYNMLEQNRDFADIRAYLEQKEINEVKAKHAEEIKTLADAHSKILGEKNNVIAKKEQIQANQKQKIDQLEQEQYNRSEQNRDFEDIRAYLEQKEINEVKAKHAEEIKTLADAHSKILGEKNNVIAKKEQIQANQKQKIDQLEQEQYNRSEQNRDFEDIRAYLEQKEINEVKAKHAEEIKTLADAHSKILGEKNNVIAKKEQIQANQKQKIDQLEQEQYNRLEQDRDFANIRAYFQQQEVKKLQAELLEAGDRQIKQLNTKHQAEKILLEGKLNNLQTKYDVILSQADKNLVDITQDLTGRLNVAEKLSKKNAEELVKTQSALKQITAENSSKETIIVELQKKLNDNKQELARSLKINGKADDKVQELQNHNRSLEARLNVLLSQQDQNVSKIKELEVKLSSEQEKGNNYTQQIAELTEQNRIVKENLAKQILLQDRVSKIISDDNTTQELETLSQFRELVVDSLYSTPAQEIAPQTVDRVKSISSVMNDCIEATSSQLYDNISSRFNLNAHISSGDDDRGQVEVWVKQGVGAMNQKPADAGNDGYKGRTHGLFIGIDHECQLGNKNLIGAAIALNNKSKIQLRSSRGQLMTNSNIVSFYGKHYLNSQLALSGAVSYFRANTEAENFGENIDKIKTHGTRFDLELSYHKVYSDQLWQPFVGASYSNISAFDMNFKDQRVVMKTKKSRLLSGKIGTRVQLKQYSLENGINISPSIMASISKPLKIISGNRFMVNNNVLSEENNNLLTQEIKDAMLNLGGDLRINRNNIDIIASYNFSSRKKYQAHRGAIKLEVKL